LFDKITPQQSKGTRVESASPEDEGFVLRPFRCATTPQSPASVATQYRNNLPNPKEADKPRCTVIRPC